MKLKTGLSITVVLVLSLLVMGCQGQTLSPTPTPSDQPAVTPQQRTPTPPIPTTAHSPTPTRVLPSASPTLTPTSEADGCKQPSENYGRITINGRVLNLRTYEMLQYAASLYGGEIDITGDAITQGSYTAAVEASFGTHSGGGAVDLSVMFPGTYTIHEADIEPLIRALRLAGFAAWYRDFDELYDGSPVHIHAIAIGDQELSWAARQQLTGLHGYFQGNNGLPTMGNTPAPDLHRGPIVCSWMLDMGYPDMTGTPIP
ncbi:MAG: hypothetical protein ACNA70_08775 [Brevefilum sp.]